MGTDMNTAFLIYPHQLFEDLHPLRRAARVYLIEDPLFFSEAPFHAQKLLLHRASMNAYHAYLERAGIAVTYVEHGSIATSGEIASLLRKHRVESAEYYDPTDDWLHARITKALAKEGISQVVHESPMFLTSTIELREFFAKRTGARKYLMNDFYVWQRKRLNILVEHEKPSGGRWSYDANNRQPLPRGIRIPPTFGKQTSPYVLEARSYVKTHFPDAFGETEAFWCPVTFQGAKKHLSQFLEERFSSFGDYEDAMTVSSASVFHSTISPLLNIGLLTPDQVVERALWHASLHAVPLAAVEGFIRQVIGWREYVRAMYVLEGRKIRRGNYFKAANPLPRSFWTGTTGLDPVDHHIEILRKYAYTHHIPRLMVLGNVMNLCGIKPDDAYRWFMEMYLDAYDWVMVPNVYSMALYADGGILTTKPYIASSNYLRKMGDFKAGPWCETLDSLFWNFVGTHYHALQNEGRLGFIGAQYRRMPNEKRAEHAARAKRFLDRLIAGHASP